MIIYLWPVLVIVFIASFFWPIELPRWQRYAACSAAFLSVGYLPEFNKYKVIAIKRAEDANESVTMNEINSRIGDVFVKLMEIDDEREAESFRRDVFSRCSITGSDKSGWS